MRHLFLLSLTLCLVLASGCASIVSDNQSTTYIQTEPEEARCELHGQDFVRVLNTPTSVSLPSEAAPLTVACTAPGYKNTVQTLDTKGDGWVWGNIIFGGVIGAVVDAGRGAGQKFPPQFMVMLEPERFKTIAERDSFYDARVALIEKKWGAAIAKLEKSCDPSAKSPSAQCRKLDKLEKEKQAELTSWEEKRLNATVDAPAPTPEALPTAAQDPETTAALGE